jgi:glucokinase
VTVRLIAADVGGTKTLIELIEAGPSGMESKVERRYESELYPTFESMLREFIAVAGQPDIACFAVAGPVVHRSARVTNLPWQIDADAIAAEFSLRNVILVNDFYAVAAGVPHLNPGDLRSIHQGRRAHSAPIAILGAGTGLGEAMVVPSASGWIVIPSEGGHADFGPADPAQDLLLTRLRARYGHVSWERIVSGPGLINILASLRDSRPELAIHDFTSGAPDDDLPALIAHFDGEGNPLARATFDVFLSAYGAEAGNLALKCLARGGVFLAGGIGAKNAERLADGIFMKAFADKGRFRDLVLECPVDLITNARVGLIGAAHLALESAAQR